MNVEEIQKAAAAIAERVKAERAAKSRGTWGGPRDKAGRKPSGKTTVSVRLKPENAVKLKALGGSSWLDGLLDEL